MIGNLSTSISINLWNWKRLKYSRYESEGAAFTDRFDDTTRYLLGNFVYGKGNAALLNEKKTKSEKYDITKHSSS